jgi:hypothetical protein
MYTNSSNWGQSWSVPEEIGRGRNPTIAIGPTGGTPWVLWYNRGYYVCAIRRPDGTWKTRTILGTEEEPIEDWSVGPSMVMATPSAEQYLGDLAYAVITDRFERIRFIPFDSVQNYCREPVIYAGHPCLAPSISITPADLLHIVWQRDVGDDGKIFYTTTEKVHPNDIRNGIPPNWLGVHRISQPEYTEPASNPSVEAYGEYVYAAWRGPNQDSNSEYGDIWRRARRIWENPEEWRDPENKSETRDNESNYPVMSTDFVTVCQEKSHDNIRDNWDIWGRFEAEPNAEPFFVSANPSKYPHIHGFWDKEIAQFLCYTIWTEEIQDPLYEVRFGRARYIPRGEDKEKVALYYTVDIGKDSASPYCLERDGYLTQSSYSVDYADEKLKYKLPYLNPQYSYLLRAIVYRTGVGNWIEDVYVDRTLTTTILSEPYQPETVWITIPKELYEYDTEIEKEIEKIIGRRALIADLRVYQVEEIDSTGTGSGQQSAGNGLIQRPILYQSAPNPAKMRTVIRYSLPVAGKISLQLYDISGRLVKTLVDKHQNAGNYALTLNSKTLSAGVYFYHLKTDGFADTKRIILIK